MSKSSSSNNSLLYVAIHIVPLVVISYCLYSLNGISLEFEKKSENIQNTLLPQLNSLIRLAASQQALGGDIWGTLGNYGDNELRNNYLNHTEQDLAEAKKAFKDFENLNSNSKKLASEFNDYATTTDKLVTLLKEKTPKSDEAAELFIHKEWFSNHSRLADTIKTQANDVENLIKKYSKENIEKKNADGNVFLFLIWGSIVYSLLFMILYAGRILTLNQSHQPIAPKQEPTKTTLTKSSPIEIKKSASKPTVLVKKEIPNKQRPVESAKTTPQFKMSPSTVVSATKNSETPIKKSKAAELIPFDEDEDRNKLGNAEDF